MRVLSSCLIIKAENNFEEKTIDYIAYAKEFDKLKHIQILEGKLPKYEYDFKKEKWRKKI